MQVILVLGRFLFVLVFILSGGQKLMDIAGTASTIGSKVVLPEALGAYTVGPAHAMGVQDEGHLRPGARADLAILSVDVDTLARADERLAGVRSVMTMVDGREVPAG